MILLFFILLSLTFIPQVNAKTLYGKNKKKEIQGVSDYSNYNSSIFSGPTEEWIVKNITSFQVLAFFLMAIVLFFLYYIVSKFNIKSRINSLTAAQIMNKSYPLAETHFSLQKVMDILIKYNIRHIPVVSGVRTIQGIVTMKDIIEFIETEKKRLNVKDDDYILSFYRIDNIMKREVVFVSPYGNMKKILEIIMTKNFGCLPVVDSAQRILGAITRTELMKKIAEYLIR